MLDGNLTSAEEIRQFLDPNSVSLTQLVNQNVFLVLVTVILTLAVWRSRRLVRRQVSAEAQRAALSRYFSPNIVRELSTHGEKLDEPTRQPVAVLFADMVGFTDFSETASPAALVELLRAFHGGLVRVAFAHDGTVDKYIGDANRLEYTVLGDTVNVASRLERLTRDVDGSLVVSDALVQAVWDCGVDPSSIVDGLRVDQARTVRGRREPVATWCTS
jgi:adenylate cyclase